MCLDSYYTPPSQPSHSNFVFKIIESSDNFEEKQKFEWENGAINYNINFL